MSWFCSGVAIEGAKLNLSSLRVVGKKQVEDWLWIHLTKAMIMIGLETFCFQLF